MKLLGVVLLLMTISICSSEVVQDFTVTCGEFFADPCELVSPPTRWSEEGQYKQICQRLNNRYEYATYYDTDNKIPVYSAYKFEGSGGCTRKNIWCVEPQLYSQNKDKNMIEQTKVSSKDKELYETAQALDTDYEKSSYHRGHLVPVYHASAQSCSDATFTLTNAAPQNPSFNQGQWKKAEREVAQFLTTDCLNKSLSAYIVTGVVPGLNQINNRVNVPSYFWSAYCCLDNNKRPKVSGGYYGENVKNGNFKEFVSEEELERMLKIFYGKQFKLFGKGCSEIQRTTPNPRKRPRSKRHFQ